VRVRARASVYVCVWWGGRCEGRPIVGPATAPDGPCSGHTCEVVGFWCTCPLRLWVCVRQALEGSSDSAGALAVRASLSGGDSVSDAAVVQLVLDEVRSVEDRATASGLCGWILVDFPRTLPQAQLFEQGLTGFVDVLEAPSTGATLWGPLVAPAPVVPADPHLVTWPHGIDVVLKLDLPRDRVVRRLLGARVPREGMPSDAPAFHMDLAPPPSGLPRRGEVVSASADPTLQGVAFAEVLEKADALAPAVEAWFRRGDVLVPVRCWRHESLEACEAGGADPAVYAPLGDWSQPGFDALNEDELFGVLSHALVAGVERAEQGRLARSQGSQAFADAQQRVTAARAARAGAGFANASGADHTPVPLPTAGAPGDAPPSVDVAEVKEEVAAGADIGARGSAGAGAAGAEGADIIPVHVSDEELGVVVPRLSVASLSTAEVLLGLWTSTVQRYGCQIQRALRGLRFERAGVVWRCSVTRRRFAHFARRASPAMDALVDAFQANYNAVRNLVLCSCVNVRVHTRVCECVSMRT
jgi:hypothetical protein